ncbi:hypothetical protein AQJ66_04095 [Streptomyces bungoensis]|uniref:DUF6745 domain-containing protein n=1 Tax=Streptomyces bungoensis TaxID=285568 RepID=A0A101TC06_9ACTN|nr:hypothetical protein [Streptomyces bungoensis]KUN89628.1 hypothetical protein AQJ66_04095 [Streptomyces bungoensis]
METARAAQVQETAQPDTTARWREVAAATGPADRPAAEAGVRLAYRLAGLPEPERIVWAGSPREGAALAARLTADGTAGRSVREAVRTRPWAAARERVLDRLGPAGWAGHWALTGAQLWEGATMLTERIRTGVVEASAAGEEGGEQAVRLVLLDAVLGQHDAAWLAAFDGQDGADSLAGIAAVARAAGWWWPYEKTAVVCERPGELHRDEAGRLDRGDGPALAFPDGFALYAWRGMPVPAAFLAELAGLTPERIREEENAELRRVMLEHYGYDRYLEESGAEPVQRDEAGVLWRIDLDGDEPLVMVEVVNSTPEPDGTHRVYWLRVPPRVRTAREGVAWTFGLEEADYTPERET